MFLLILWFFTSFMLLFLIIAGIQLLVWLVVHLLPWAVAIFVAWFVYRLVMRRSRR